MMTAWKCLALGSTHKHGLATMTASREATCPRNTTSEETGRRAAGPFLAKASAQSCRLCLCLLARDRDAEKDTELGQESPESLPTEVFQAYTIVLFHARVVFNTHGISPTEMRRGFL